MPHYFNDFVLNRALEQAATNGWIVRTNPFEGGSDHTPFLRAGKPGLLFWHFTDQFYHTDRDRIEMVSPSELKNVGVTALVSALALTSVDEPMAVGLVNELVRAGEVRLAAEAQLSAQALKGQGGASREREIIETWADWYIKALDTFSDFGTEVQGPEFKAAIEQGHARLAAARDEALGVAGLR